MNTLIDSLNAIKDKYPHVHQKLEVLWGTVECKNFISDLITPKRDDRSGFSFEVLMEINKISEHHRQAYPHLYKQSVWDPF